MAGNYETLAEAIEHPPQDVLMAPRYAPTYKQASGMLAGREFKGPCCLFAVSDGAPPRIERYVNDGAGGYFTPYPSAENQAAVYNGVTVMAFAGSYRLTIEPLDVEKTVVNLWNQEPPKA